jgi:hypothetical protein
VQTINKSISTIITNQPWIRFDVWSEALNFFQQTHNRTPNISTKPKSRHEIITGEKTDLVRQFKYAFGELVIINVIPPINKPFKLDIRANLGT